MTVRRRRAPTREEITAAVETALGSALLEVVVTQDGHLSNLDRLVRVLDNAGLIAWSAVDLQTQTDGGG